MTESLDYPPRDQEDQILLMLDNTQATLNQLMALCRECADMDTNKLGKKIRAYVKNNARLDMIRVGDNVQAECLKDALYDMGELMGDRYPQYWWSVAEYYRQKYQEQL